MKALLGIAKHGAGENVYLVRFHYLLPASEARYVGERPGVIRLIVDGSDCGGRSAADIGGTHPPKRHILSSSPGTRATCGLSQAISVRRRTA